MRADFKLILEGIDPYFELVDVGVTTGITEPYEMPTISPDFILNIPRVFFCRDDGSFLPIWLELVYTSGFDKPVFALNDYGFH